MRDWMKSRAQQKRFPELVLVPAVTAWFLTALCSFSWNGTDSIAFFQTKNFSVLVLLFLVLWLALLILTDRSRDLGNVVMGIAAFLYSVLCVAETEEIWYCMGMALLCLLIFYYGRSSWLLVGSCFRVSWKQCKIGYGILLVCCALFIGVITVLRYRVYYSPGFDFGIFAQMFEYMKETGLPYTTYERNMLLSHFAVHASPVYYLLLPFYLLFPNPVTLQIAQAVVVALGLIPLYLLCRQYRLRPGVTLALGAVYVLFPALSEGCMYDIHENCFLTVFLLFFFWSVEAGKKWLVPVFLVLTLMVKEDAALVMTVVGLYYLISGRDRKRGAATAVFSLCYFLLILFLMERFGLGVMDNSRCSNFIYEEGSGMIQMIKAVFMNPGYALREAFDPEKIEYLLLMTVPAGGAMLANKKYSGFILLLPMMVFNLLPEYVYMHEIGFQYNFANTALIFYLIIQNISGFTEENRKKWVIAACVLSVLFFSCFNLGRVRTVRAWNSGKSEYRKMDAFLEEVPRDGSVSASGFLAPHLWEIKELYPLSAGMTTDYLVVDIRTEGYREEAEPLIRQGYEKIMEEPGLIAVYERSAGE